MLSYSHQFAKKLKSTSMSQENTVLDACLFRVGKLVRFQSQMHLSKICQVQAPVVQKVDIFVPQRRPAPIVLLSRSSYTKEFTCKLDCSSYLSGYCTRDHESSDRCWPPLGIKIYFYSQSETSIGMSRGTVSLRVASRGLRRPFLKTFAAVFLDPTDRPWVCECAS